ncbi:protein of unknown function (plasmid) [Cupriavidus taiwanensis]|uniref:Uncharacterized protein n=1 Tax=Cupriavidus taiwanensis TaxID=164546 RepID=A0A375IQR5_9BURK|nr:protein of unknown function [Cupriavidus taiwanensis]
MTEAGRGLQARAKPIPGSVLCASACSDKKLAELRAEPDALRARFADGNPWVRQLDLNLAGIPTATRLGFAGKYIAHYLIAVYVDG